MAELNYFSRSYGLKAHTLAFVYGAMLLLTASCGAEQSLQFARSSISVGNGDRAILECVLIGNPIVGSQFTWSGPALSNGHTQFNIAHRTTVSTLTIDDVGTEDGGEYECSYTGLETISTTLTVLVSPGFLNVQEHQTFAEGTDAVVLCPAFLGENPQGEMYWFRDNRLFNDDRFSPSNGKLTIQNIRNEDSGSDYKCTISRNGVNLNQAITVEVLPQHKFAPRINDSQRRIEVVYGEELNLPCLLEEPKDNVVYSWTINTNLEHDVLVTSHGQLQRDADKFLGGIYTCRAVNQYGFDIVDFSVKIQVAPLPEECSHVRKITALGTTVVLKYCGLTSPVELSDLDFQWSKRNDGGELVDVELGERVSVNHNGWLTIKNVQQSDLGVYQVNISNEMGNAVHTVQLELVQATTAQLTTQNPSLSQAQVGAVSFSLEFTVNSDIYSCDDVKENLIKQHLFEEFGFSDVVIEGVVISCSSESEKVGSFKANLRGSNAEQLATLIRERGTTTLTLKNGLSLTLQVCTNDCSSSEPESTEASRKPISNFAGIIIAVTFICVVLAGAILLMVILIRYRRRSLTKQIDEEQVKPLHFTDTTESSHKIKQGYSNLDRGTTNSFVIKKPFYGRSISVSLPITST